MASSGGRGFIVRTEDVIAQTKNGKQALNVKGDDEAAAICPVLGDHVAIIGDNRKLLVFPLDGVPEMSRGRGVILQRYKDGGLADIKTFNKIEGLSWKTGDRTRTETILRHGMANEPRQADYRQRALARQTGSHKNQRWAGDQIDGTFRDC